MAQREEEPLILSCPYAIQGCAFSTKEETELKTHLKECQYFMNEYIKEFLQKKKQELEKENKTDQAQLIDQAIQKNPGTHQSEYLSDMVVNASKSMWGYFSKGFSKISDDIHGSEILPKAKDTIGKTFESVSSTISDTSSTIWNTTGQLTQDMEFVSTVSEVMHELKSEFSEAITALANPPPEDYQPTVPSIVNTSTERRVHFSIPEFTTKTIQVPSQEAEDHTMQLMPISPQPSAHNQEHHSPKPEPSVTQPIKRAESDMDEISLEEALKAEELPDVTNEMITDLVNNRSNDSIDIEAILKEAEEDTFV